MNIILDRLVNIMAAFVGIFDNLLCIITLGNFCPAYEMRVLAMKLKIKKRK